MDLTESPLPLDEPDTSADVEQPTDDDQGTATVVDVEQPPATEQPEQPKRKRRGRAAVEQPTAPEQPAGPVVQPEPTRRARVVRAGSTSQSATEYDLLARVVTDGEVSIVRHLADGYEPAPESTEALRVAWVEWMRFHKVAMGPDETLVLAHFGAFLPPALSALSRIAGGDHHAPARIPPVGEVPGGREHNGGIRPSEERKNDPVSAPRATVDGATREPEPLR